MAWPTLGKKADAREADVEFFAVVRWPDREMEGDFVIVRVYDEQDEAVREAARLELLYPDTAFAVVHLGTLEPILWGAPAARG